MNKNYSAPLPPRAIERSQAGGGPSVGQRLTRGRLGGLRVGLVVVVVAVVAVGLLAGCAPTGASVEELAAVGIVDVEVEEAVELMAGGGVVLLDIRTPREHAAGRIAGSVNLDYGRSDFAERLAELDRDGVYVMYCATGGRSGRALEWFKEQGFTSVHHLRSGFEGWRAAGGEVAR